MKEASLVLGWLLAVLPVSESSPAVSSTLSTVKLQRSYEAIGFAATDFVFLCEWMRDLMLQCRHKGVVELLSSAFEPICMRYVS